jgi:hypothetical protein
MLNFTLCGHASVCLSDFAMVIVQICYQNFEGGKNQSFRSDIDHSDVTLNISLRKFRKKNTTLYDTPFLSVLLFSSYSKRTNYSGILRGYSTNCRTGIDRSCLSQQVGGDWYSAHGLLDGG